MGKRQMLDLLLLIAFLINAGNIFSNKKILSSEIEHPSSRNITIGPIEVELEVRASRHRHASCAKCISCTSISLK
jgi:hypothetical protein